MNLHEILDHILFEIGSFALTVEKLFLLLLALLFTIWLWQWVLRRFLPNLTEGRVLNEKERYKLFRNTKISIILLFILLALVSLGLNPTLFEYQGIAFKISWLMLALLLLQAGHVLDIYLIELEKERSVDFARRSTEIAADSVTQQARSSRRTISRTIYWIVFIFLILFLIERLEFDRALYTFSDDTTFNVSNIVMIILILLLTHLFVWIFIHIILNRYYKVRNIEPTGQYALNQLIRYVGYVIGFYVAIASSGIEMTLILGGAAALLVGVGLGLQQTFNDVFSGILLLSERRIEVGDFIEVDGLIGAIKEIGLRASVLETWDQITVIVPNSRLVSINVINWSHFTEEARFHVDIGVAYGSDTEKVKRILLTAADRHNEIHKQPEPTVILAGFGESSLDFKLYFWTDHFKTVQRIRSDLRFIIDKAFREEGVTIPFPQRDLWFRNKGPKEDS